MKRNRVLKKDKIKPDDLHLSEKTLIDISIFINDMRLLKNIINEFCIIRTAINDPNLVSEKLFGMIVFKNIYPHEYNNLVNNNGRLYDMINNKNNVIEQKIIEHKKELDKLKSKYESLDGTMIEEKEDALIIFNRRLSKYIGLSGNYNVRLYPINKYFSVPTNMDELINCIGSNKEEIKFIEVNQKEFSVDNFLTLNGTCRNVEDQMKALEIDKSNQKSRLSELIKDTERKIIDIHQLPIKDLYDNGVIPSLKDSELLNFLIINGYIEEDYADYLTYFYPGSLTPNDYKYLKIIKAGRKVNTYGYSIDNVNNVIDRLSVNSLEWKGYLNVELLKGLFNNNKLEFNNKIISLINYLNDHRGELISFLSYALESNSNLSIIGTLFQSIYINKKELFEYIINNELVEKYNKEITKIFSEDFTKDMAKLSSGTELSKAIGESESFLNWNIINNKDKNNKIENFKLASIKFSKLKYKDGTESAIRELIENNLIALNQNMLSIALNTDKDKINFNKIKEYDSKVLLNNILKDEQFLDILLNLNKYDEKEEYFIQLLNQSKGSIQKKESLIKKWYGRITNLSSISEEKLYPVIFKNRKMTFNYDNIMHGFEYVPQKTILKSLNDNQVFGCFMDSVEDTDNEILSNKKWEKLSILIQTNDLIKGEIVEPYLSGDKYFANYIDLYHLEETSTERLSILISNGCIDWSRDAYEFIKSRDNSLAFNFIKKSCNEGRSLETIFKDIEKIDKDLVWEIWQSDLIIDDIDKFIDIHNNEFEKFDEKFVGKLLSIEKLKDEHLNFLNSILDNSLLTPNAYSFILKNHKNFKIKISLDIHEKNIQLLKNEVESHEFFNIVNILIKSNMVEEGFKWFLINKYTTDLISNGYSLSNIYHFLKEKEFQSLNKKVFKETILQIKDENENTKASLLLKGLRQYEFSKDDYISIVKSLGEPYSNLSRFGKRNNVITKTKSHKELLQFLLKKEFISSYWIEESKHQYMFNVKQSYVYK